MSLWRQTETKSYMPSTDCLACARSNVIVIRPSATDHALSAQSSDVMMSSFDLWNLHDSVPSDGTRWMYSRWVHALTDKSTYLNQWDFISRMLHKSCYYWAYLLLLADIFLHFNLHSSGLLLSTCNNQWWWWWWWWWSDTYADKRQLRFLAVAAVKN